MADPTEIVSIPARLHKSQAIMMDKEYMVEMDWDPKTTKPSRKRLLELGLEDVAGELWS